jgi:hypothetical protein
MSIESIVPCNGQYPYGEFQECLLLKDIRLGELSRKYYLKLFAF